MNAKAITTLSVAMVGILALGACAADMVQTAQASEATKPTRIKHVDPSAGAKLLAESSVRVLDIRTPKEFAGRYIGGAPNIDFNALDFDRQLTGLTNPRPTWSIARPDAAAPSLWPPLKNSGSVPSFTWTAASRHGRQRASRSKRSELST